jgi:dihydroorotate dehydrogenase electron transfer subunit
MSNRIFHAKAKLIKNIEVIKKYYKILVFCPGVAKLAKPGQFVQVKVNNGDQPLLRRPLGIHRVMRPASLKRQADCEQIEILYEVLGQGTEILAQRKVGEYLDIIGPLGNGFDLQTLDQGLRPILVAGGMGIAPIVFLAETIINKQVAGSKGPKPLVLIGAKTKKQLLCIAQLESLGCEVRVATDDGSRGFRGKVTNLLQRFLASVDQPALAMYSCGPRPMLKEICRLAKQYNFPAQISLEEHMACGIGACLGCVVNTTDGYKRVCKEGPVFDAGNILWG